jgi:hypothetical protein
MNAAALALQAKPAKPAAGLHRFVLPIRTEGTLRDFIACAFGVQIPDVACCHGHVSPWRAFCDAYFARHSVTVWKASRGFGGKSFLLSLLGQVEGLTLGADTNVLGGSGEQSERVLEHMRQLWERRDAPRHALKGDVSREMRLSNGAMIRALMASTRSVRGPHPSRLRVDEIDEVDQDILDAALGQTMSTPTVPAQTVLSSTHHYPDGTMTEVLKRAADRGWPVYQWCYLETMEPHGWLPAAEVARKKNEVPAGMWEAEYELQEPSPESRAIMPASVKAMFQEKLGIFAGEPRQYIETEAPDPKGEYSTGQDWAKKRDWCITWTLRHDCKPARFVAFERVGREPWPAMVARFDYQVRRYGSTAAHDGLGVGDVVNDLITVPAHAFIMAGRDRADLLNNYIAAIETGKIVAPMIRYAEAEHRMASRAIYQGGDEHLPDTIAAGALAWWAATKGQQKWSQGSQ